MRIAIDDFGTGHSSLARLKAMPVDELKIDKSFVLNMADDDRDAAVVEVAAITLGRRLSLAVVAEGVETDAAWARLRHLGCEQAQGYLRTEPLPADELEAWAAARLDPVGFMATAADAGAPALSQLPGALLALRAGSREPV